MNTSNGASSASPSIWAANRWQVYLLAVLGPTGLGHWYLGRRKRAVFWLPLPWTMVACGALALPSIGISLGFCTAGVAVVAAALLVWGASIADLALQRNTQLQRPSALAISAFWIGGILFALAVRLLIRVFLLEAFMVPSGAMGPTLLAGDHVFADKLSVRNRSPKRGEVVVFRFPEDRDVDYVFRVVGLPGDRIEMHDGHPWINGWSVPRCLVGKGRIAYTSTVANIERVTQGEVYVEFLDGEAYLVMLDEQDEAKPQQGPYVVAPGELFVLGDKRNDAHDSRTWYGNKGGGVPLADVRGRVLFRWLAAGFGVSDGRVGLSLSVPVLPESMRDLQPNLDKCIAEHPAWEETVAPAP